MQQTEAPRKSSIGKPVEVHEEAKHTPKEVRNRTRSGSTAEYSTGKKKTPMQKTYLEDAYFFDWSNLG